MVNTLAWGASPYHRVMSSSLILPIYAPMAKQVKAADLKFAGVYPLEGSIPSRSIRVDSKHKEWWIILRSNMSSSKAHNPRWGLSTRSLRIMAAYGDISDFAFMAELVDAQVSGTCTERC